MAHRAVARAYSVGPVTKEPLVPRSVFLAGRWSGSIELELAFDRKSPLVVGAGRLDLHVEKTRGEVRIVTLGRKRIRHQEPDRTEEFLVAEVVRRGARQVPVIPGSSFKGALRQAYELLTPSCEPGLGRSGSCSARPKDPNPQVCPACSLFGAMGLAARISFQEATPLAEPHGARVELRRVPTPWGDQVPVAGSYRFYDQQRSAGEDGKPRPEVEATWAVSGKFKTRLGLVNTTEDELGLLIASLGIGADPAGPSIRLGGKKFHGFGGARIRIVAARQQYRERRLIQGDQVQPWALALREAALDRDAMRRPVWQALHRILPSTG
jgi:hypothetical protein